MVWFLSAQSACITCRDTTMTSSSHLHSFLSVIKTSMCKKSWKKLPEIKTSRIKMLKKTCPFLSRKTTKVDKRSQNVGWLSQRELCKTMIKSFTNGPWNASKVEKNSHIQLSGRLCAAVDKKKFPDEFVLPRLKQRKTSMWLASSIKSVRPTSRTLQIWAARSKSCVKSLPRSHMMTACPRKIAVIRTMISLFGV